MEPNIRKCKTRGLDSPNTYTYTYTYRKKLFQKEQKKRERISISLQCKRIVNVLWTFVGVVAIRIFHSVPQFGDFRSTQPLKLRGLIRTIRWLRWDSNFEYNREYSHYSVGFEFRVFATIRLVGLWSVCSHFVLFGWFPISNIRHYSVGFEFRIFATIRSIANIRTVRLGSNFEYSPLFGRKRIFASVITIRKRSQVIE